MKKTVSHANIPELEPLLKNLPDIFEKEGRTIKKGRNELKIIEYEGIRLCVKSFNKVTAFNRLMYSWFRETKAQRSFRIAQKLLAKGIETPMPAGYTETSGPWGIADKSYYVSLYHEHDFLLKDVLKGKHADAKNIINDFARFMGKKVHPAGIWHNDMSNGNVLISCYQNNYSFALIDLNRIKFKSKILPSQGLRNLKRLNGGTIQMALLAQQYAIVTEKDPRRFVFRLFGNQLAFESFRRQTKRILHALDPTRKKSVI